MIFWGLADHRVEEVIDFYATRGEAEETLKQVLEDEPGWVGVLEVVAVESRVGVRELAASFPRLCGDALRTWWHSDGKRGILSSRCAIFPPAQSLSFSRTWRARQDCWTSLEPLSMRRRLPSTGVYCGVPSAPAAASK
jgi:hypothetical protein